MAKDPNLENERWMEDLNRQFDRLDQMFEEVNSPSFEELEMLAVRTAKNRRLRQRKEFLIFLMVAVFIVGSCLMAALAIPRVFLIIHGISLLTGITILLFNEGVRGKGKREIQ